MTTKKRKILVTSALIYANGPLHLGHLVEAIQTDIWVRFQKMRGHDCLYICGDDAHGTPIMLSAAKQQITPEQLIEQVGVSHRQDYADFLIEFDNFYTTHSSENREMAEKIYSKLKARGDITTKTIKQAYDPVENIFLPDRFVKGECPRCGSKDQNGDNCEVCGATYTPADLKNPISILSGVPPIEKESLHYFFSLDNYADMLRQWTRAGHLQEQVTNKLNEWLDAGLQKWDISRDKPYFGFEIPDAPGKYFYVWMDAPIGYIASFMDLAKRHPALKFAEYWELGSTVELYHFVGKDIIYFHALFWPAMLHGADLRTPTAIFSHGFLTINGQKMSKSRGTFIQGRSYLNHFAPEYLRYYFAAKLSNGIEDIDLNLQDFMQRVNADLVGKVINIASRTAGFISKNFQGKLAAEISESDLYQQIIKENTTIAAFYENREYNRVVRLTMELADQINQYINDKAPWALAKQEGTQTQVQQICSMGLNLFRVLIIYLQPILPDIAKKVAAFLNCSPFTWDDITQPLLNHTINPFTPLLKRIEADELTALQEDSKTPS